MSAEPGSRIRSLICAVAAFSAAALAHGSRRAQATTWREGFDDGRTSWTIRYDRERLRVLSHRRHRHIRRSGEACENIELVVGREGGIVHLQHALPAARVIEDLTASLWVRSNRAGAVPALRVVFPRQKDPRSGRTMSAWIRGDVYTGAGRWQQLKCSTAGAVMRDLARRLRYQFPEVDLDLGGAYVDEIILAAQLDSGAVELFIDELQLAPVVNQSQPPVRTVADSVPQSGGDGDATRRSPVEFRLDRLTVEGRPFFPRMAATHGEPVELLRQTGFNVVWVPDYGDRELLGQIRQSGMWAMATPPTAASESGQTLSAHRASILPFGEETRAILFWNFGTRIAPSSREELVDWIRQVERADRHFGRPLMADVIGLERVYSRYVPMLGLSRHVLNTSMTPGSYRNWLIERRRLARLGSFVWTWIQTEPASATSEYREAIGATPVVVEPEQIRLQVYAALAAGCRGLGYWKTASLTAGTAGALERRLSIARLNLELELLEPWLATGTIVTHTPFSVERPSERKISQRRLDFRSSDRELIERDALLRAREDRIKRTAELPGELQATVIRSDVRRIGTLILPVWYQTDAQFCPGQLAGNSASIVVRGVPDQSRAFEITTTAVRSLPRERVTGGLKITWPNFDQTAILLVTSDPAVVEELREQVARIAPRSAQLAVELARTKLDRVHRVNSQLAELGVRQPDAPQLLGKAGDQLRLAAAAKARGDYDAARSRAAAALQLARILQRAHWEDAVRPLSSPLSSPHAVCFQTLPDHWRMVARLGRSPSRGEENLVPSGDFEDIDRMVSAGWRHVQNVVEGVRASAELYPLPQGERSVGVSDASDAHRFALRIAAAAEPGRDSPGVVTENPVTVVTPAIEVKRGQIVHISGRVKMTAGVQGSLDGVMLYDSFTGPTGAVRWLHPHGWRKFELIREVPRDGPLTVTISLTGLGDVQFDDVRIVAVSPPPAFPAPKAAGAESADRSGPLDLLGRWPRLR